MFLLLDVCHITSLLVSANPCGDLQQGVVYQCWDERTLAGVAECTLAGVTGTSEPLRGLRSVPLRGQLSQVSETTATLPELWEGSLESCECRVKDKPAQELDCARC